VRVLVFEDNLMWSSRLTNTLRKLGHEPELRRTPDSTGNEAPVAIVNLGADSFGPTTLVPVLRAAGVTVIGHAGHKEKELHELGRQAGCDILATNSELTYKIEALLERAVQIGAAVFDQSL
jgi:hypothetical protein